MSASVLPEDAGLLEERLPARKVCKPRCVATLVVEVFASLLSGIVLAVRGGGGDSVVFHCDVAAIALLCSLVFVALPLSFLVDLCVPPPPPETGVTKSRSDILLDRLQLVLHVATMCLVCLTLLAHATLVLVQLLLVLSASCWVICTCSVPVRVYRWYTGYTGPAAARALLAIPLGDTLGAFLGLTILAYAFLYFKPASEIGLPAEPGRFEVFILFALGGCMISSVAHALFWWLFTRIYPTSERILLWSTEAEGVPLGTWMALARAAMLSIVTHFFASAFVFILMYGVVTCLIVGLACLSLRGSRAPHEGDEGGAEGTSADGQKRPAVPGEKVPKDSGTLGIVKQIAVTTFMLMFGFGKVVVLFCIFLFDVTFIQRHLAGTTTRGYVLARTGWVCGSPSGVREAWDIRECASIVGSQVSAFSFGTGENDGQCIAHTFPNGYSDEAYNALQKDPANWDCLNADTDAWSSKPNFNFYVLEPPKHCSVFTGRRLQEVVSNATTTPAEQGTFKDMPVYYFGGAMELPQAISRLLAYLSLHALGDNVASMVRSVMRYLRWVLDVRVRIPDAFDLKCAGVRRLVSAFTLLGAVLAVVAIAALDVMGVMAASTGIAKVRAMEAQGFASYITIMARAHALEQMALLCLQITVSSGIAFELETVAVFAQHCGVLVQEDSLAGLDCPAFWHLPVDFVAVTTIYFSCCVALLAILGTLGGSLYGLTTLRWAVLSLFGNDLRLARFGASGTTKADQIVAGDHSLLISPLFGVPVSFGVWTSRSTHVFKIGQRQDWYEPVAPASAEQNGGRDFVSWKCMYESTSRVISLAWLPIPYVGGILSKGSQYLNEHVIFAFGNVGTGSSHDEGKPIISHFQQDEHVVVHVLHWVARASCFLVLVLINLDFLGLTFESRGPVLSACVAVVIIFAAVRVGVEIVQELKVFVATRGLGDFTEAVINGGVPVWIAQQDGKPDAIADFDGRNGGVACAGGTDPLDGLCGGHRIRVVRSCVDLMEVKWVRDCRFGNEQRRVLATTRSRTSRWHSTATRLLRAMAAGDKAVTEGMARAAVLLLVRDALDTEISSVHADRAAEAMARKTARERAEDEAREAQLHAEDHARAELAREATARVSTFEAAKAEYFAKQGYGDVPVRPVKPPCWMRMSFTSQYRVRAEACTQVVNTKRKFTDDRVVTAVVTVSGAAQVDWGAREATLEFSPADVGILPGSRHQITFDHDGQQDDGPDVNATPDAATPLPQLALEVETNSCRLCPWDAKARRGTCCCSSSLCGEETFAGSEGWELASPVVTTQKPELSVDVSPRPGEWEKIAEEVPEEVMDAMHELEDAIRRSIYTPQSLSLAGAFLGALSTSGLSLSGEDAARRARMMAVAMRMLRRRVFTTRAPTPFVRPSSRTSPTRPFSMPMSLMRRETEASIVVLSEEQPSTERVLSLESLQLPPLECLRAAMSREPPDADELSMALDRARVADIEPLLLMQAEQLFMRLIDRQQQALALVQAMDCGMISVLRNAIASAEALGIEPQEFPNSAGEGVLAKAHAILRQQTDGVRAELQAAIQVGGALRLRRATLQADEAMVGGANLIVAAEAQLHAIGERKRCIALLKMAMASRNVGLLTGAIAECERRQAADNGLDGVDVRNAKKLLEQLENATSNMKEAVRRRHERLAAEEAAKQPLPPISGSPVFTDAAMDIARNPDALKRVRANAALRAAVYQEPPDHGMLRLAVDQAKATGLSGPQLERAEEMLAQEEEKEKVLVRLRRGAAMRDPTELSASIAQCSELGVDPKQILSSLTQLIEDHGRVARLAGDHGLSDSVLTGIEAERRKLHDTIQQASGGLRTICRIRPRFQDEPDAPADRRGLQRLDRSTLLIEEVKHRFNTVFGPDTIQAEVFNELRSLVQSAVDGYNVLLMACGPARSGKTHTMRGGASAENRGMIPRVVDELFSIRDRDSWRANLEVDVQMVEVYTARHMADVLGVQREHQRRAAGGQPNPNDPVPGMRPFVRLVPLASFDSYSPSSPRSQRAGVAVPSYVVLEGAATRRVAKRTELRNLVEDCFERPLRPGVPHSLLVMLHLTRTNRATGAMTRSKIVFVDLVSCSQTSGHEAKAAHDALEAVFVSLARQERRVPFRDHLLTQALQDCVGASAKTVFVLTLPPAGVGNNAECLRAVQLAACGQW